MSQFIYKLFISSSFAIFLIHNTCKSFGILQMFKTVVYKDIFFFSGAKITFVREEM